MSSTPHSRDDQQTQSVNTHQDDASGPQPQVLSDPASGPQPQVQHSGPQQQVWQDHGATQAQDYAAPYGQETRQQPYAQGYQQPYAQQYQGGWNDGPDRGWQPRQFSGDRPGSLIAASILTWVGSAVYLALGLAIIMAGAGATSFSREVDWASSNSSDAEAVGWIGLLVSVIALASFVLAVFAHHGERWAVIALSGLGGLMFVLAMYAAVQYPPAGMLALIWLGIALALYWMSPSQRYYTWRQQRG